MLRLDSQIPWNDVRQMNVTSGHLEGCTLAISEQLTMLSQTEHRARPTVERARKNPVVGLVIIVQQDMSID